MLSYEEARKIGKDFCIDTIGREYCLQNREGSCWWYSTDTSDDVVNVGVGIDENWDRPISGALLSGETKFEVYVTADVVRSTGEIRVLEKHLPKVATGFATA